MEGKRRREGRAFVGRQAGGSGMEGEVIMECLLGKNKNTQQYSITLFSFCGESMM